MKKGITIVIPPVIRQNSHSGVVQSEITLEDLFA